MFGRIKRKIGRILARIRRKSFGAEKWWQLRRLRKQLIRSKDALVVHQMSKVGSRTVVASLKQSAPEYLVLHTHFISDDGIAWLEDFVRRRWGYINVPGHLWHSYFARWLHARKAARQKLKVVTLVRDPVAREVSEFFQELDVHMNYAYRDRIERVGLNGVVAELQQMLLQKVCSDIDWKEPYSWFDREIRDVFRIDLISEPFDTKAGYTVIRGDTADVLLLKLERLAEIADQAFREFAGLEHFSLDQGRNLASDKYYADAYLALLESLRLPEDVLEACYASDHVKHFYSPAEISRFIARWSSEKHVRAASSGLHSSL